MAARKIVLVATSHDKMGDTGHGTGAWLEEIAAAYFVFQNAGFEVVIASPKGGKIPLDQKSLSEPFFTPFCEQFQKDGVATGKLEASLPLADIDADEFAAIYIAGGHGIVYDGNDPTLKKLLESFFAADKGIASVCHGAAGLLYATRGDGKSILCGKKVTGFCNTEEDAVQLTNVVPFLTEDKLKELGGIYEKAADWTPFAVVDGKLVTGQNPQSSEKVAEELVKVLG